MGCKNSISSRVWRRENKSAPYYWKLDIHTAQWFVDYLTAEYEISSVRVAHMREYYEHIPKKLNGGYVLSNLEPMIIVHSRTHIKTVVHEFYHHLDFTFWVTNLWRKYSSSD